MKKKLLIAMVIIGAMTLTGVASAANYVGVGYYFQGDSRGLTLKGELTLTDMIDVGIDYCGIKDAGWPIFTDQWILGNLVMLLSVHMEESDLPVKPSLCYCWAYGVSNR